MEKLNSFIKYHPEIRKEGISEWEVMRWMLEAMLDDMKFSDPSYEDFKTWTDDWNRIISIYFSE